MKNAGEMDCRGQIIECNVEISGDDWLHMQSKKHQRKHNLNKDLMIINRISHEYDFKNPKYVTNIVWFFGPRFKIYPAWSSKPDVRRRWLIFMKFAAR